MKNLKELRKKNKLSQEELSKVFNVNQSTITFWEKGQKETDFATLCKIADYFGVTIDYLLGREPDSGLIYVHKDPALSDCEKEIIDTYRKIPPTKHAQAVTLLNVLVEKDIKKEAQSTS